MKPDKCNYCKGTLKEGNTEFITRIKEQLLVIKKIPAWICDICGEAYFKPESSRKIDQIIEKAKVEPLLAHPIAAGEIELTD
ncbi:MAG: type II toxin-antitoxin system MqsA family antitoxin [Candidatus Heimdallarchaeota archaeon]